MKKIAALSAIAVAVLTEGCNTYQPGTPRRTILGASTPSAQQTVKRSSVRAQSTSINQESNADAKVSRKSVKPVRRGEVAQSAPVAVATPTSVVNQEYQFQRATFPEGVDGLAKRRQDAYAAQEQAAMDAALASGSAESVRQRVPQSASEVGTPGTYREFVLDNDSRMVAATSKAKEALSTTGAQTGRSQVTSSANSGSARSAPHTSETDAAGYRIYVVQPGDVASRIANDNGMKTADFLALNGITNPNLIRVGQKVKIATGASSATSAPAPTPTVRNTTSTNTSTAANSKADDGVHIVAAGETLSIIARKRGVSQDALMKANGISNPNLIRVGQRLVLPKGALGSSSRQPQSAGTAVSGHSDARNLGSATLSNGRTVNDALTSGSLTAPVTRNDPAPASEPVKATTSAPVSTSTPDSSSTATSSQPSGSSNKNATSTSTSSSSSDVPPKGWKYYTPDRDEDVYLYVMRYKVDPHTLRTMNGIPDSQNLFPAGVRILIPDKAQ